MSKTNNVTDQKIFEEVRDHAEQLKNAQGTRNEKFEEYEKIFLLQDDGLPSGDFVKKTLAPDPRNAILGAQRLLSAAKPKWTVPEAINDPETMKSSTPIEKVASAICWASGRVRKRPMWYDPVLSALLYSEVVIRIVSTKDLVDAAKTPGEKKRAQRANAMTPLLFDCINPKNCYPEFDLLGLSAWYSSTIVTWGDVKAIHGEEITKKLDENKKVYEKVTYNEYWNHTYHYVWLTEFADTPILAMEHGLDVIPIVDQICEGSELFTGDDQQTRQPFLYTVNESKMWSRQNLEYTVLYTMIHAIGTNPMFVLTTPDPNQKEMKLDFSIPGGVTKIGLQESLEALTKQVIDPSIIKGLEIAEQKGTESTIYKQALGEPLGANAPFSMVSLLNQAGRLPLVPYQRTISFALCDAMKIGLDMIRGGGEIKAIGDKGALSFYGKDIPETFELDCNLDISMPTDERSNIVMATQATFGQNPLVSQKYARENWVGIEQPDEEQEQIWAEQEASLTHQSEVMNKLQQATPQTPAGGIPQEAVSQLNNAQNTSTPGMGAEGVPMVNPVDNQGVEGNLPSQGMPPQGGQTPGPVGM